MLNNSSQPEQHLMIHDGSLQDGTDEFYCPTCGRRLLIHWPPDYKVTVLAVGDENATHAGGKSGELTGLETLNPAVDQNATNEDDFDRWDEFEDVDELIEQHIQPDSDDEYLSRWDEWLDDAGFDEWWDRAN